MPPIPKETEHKRPAKKDADADAPRNELKVSPLRSARGYISSAIDVLESSEFKSVIIKGRGKAISNVVSIAEVVKRRIKGLHQLTETESLEVTDTRKNGTEVTKHICGLSITLSLTELDTTAAGYQEPISADQVTEEDKTKRSWKPPRNNRSAGGRGVASRGRGGNHPSGGRGNTGRGGNSGGRGGGVTRGYR